MTTLMTLNLNYFGDRHGPWEERLAHLEKVLRRTSPEVAALQAVCAEPGVAGGQNQAQQIAARLPDYTEIWFEAAQRAVDEKLLGSAFIARIPCAPVAHQELPLEDNPEDDNRRILLHARVQNGEEPIELVNAHFSWVPALNRSNVAAALTYLQRLPGPALLMGDLNAPPDGPGMQHLAAAGWIDAWAQLRPDDPGYTFEADAPSQRIDYIWANPAAAPRLRAIERIPLEGEARLSDHLGLLVTLD